MQKQIVNDLGTTTAKLTRDEEGSIEDREEDASNSDFEFKPGQKNEDRLEIHQNKKNVDTWRLPLSMVLFLNTAFKTQTLVKVIPWLSLRKAIYSIYNERLLSAECFENSIYSGHVTMEEFVSFYFLKVGFSPQY